jgi:hypothetical protein
MSMIVLRSWAINHEKNAERNTGPEKKPIRLPD